VLHFNVSLLHIYSITDQAILNPSYVDVPLPTSSNKTKLLEVAFFKIFDTSHISTMKVDLPPAKSSDAPILVNILSEIEILALFAGTNDPICAIKLIRATCLM